MHRQAAAEKKKRQARDLVLKRQAEERKAAQREAARGEGEGEGVVLATRTNAAAGGRRRTDKVQFPDLLPAEFLTEPSDQGSDADDADDDDDDAAEGREQRARTVAAVERRLARQDRAPRDEQLGSTLFRVAREQDGRLAPTAKSHSKGSKEALMRRNRTATKPRGGFLIGK